MSQMQAQARGGAGAFDFEQTIFLNRTMFDDKMYLRYGFTAKDFQRAIVKYGIYDQRMKEAKELEQQ